MLTATIPGQKTYEEKGIIKKIVAFHLIYIIFKVIIIIWHILAKRFLIFARIIIIIKDAGLFLFTDLFMTDMEIEDFENEIIKVLEGLPEKFRDKFENINFMIEENLLRHDMEDPEHGSASYTLGLYQGLPMTMRFRKYSIFPDRITIFKKPLESISRNEEELKKNIKRVVLHEVGHYFGLSEKKLRELGY